MASFTTHNKPHKDRISNIRSETSSHISLAKNHLNSCKYKQSDSSHLSTIFFSPKIAAARLRYLV